MEVLNHNALPAPWRRAYFTGRFLIVAVFVVGGIFFVFSVLFPPQAFFFDFKNSKSQANTLADPRNTSGEPRRNGRLESNESLVLSASVFGEYSAIDISVAGEDDASMIQSGSVSVRRSQQAFFYPSGEPAGFPSGTLLRESSGFYRIAQDGSRKQFPSESAIRAIGLDPDSFLAVSEEELSFNPDGGSEEVSADTPPDGSFIRSDSTYYEWRDGILFPFVSNAAFLARFPDAWAIPKDVSFVNSHTVSETWRGFPSASLLAWGDGVFLMDGTSPRAILGVDIFLSLGYSWDDVIAVSDEELSLEQKGKPVDFGVPHPTGTVIFDTLENRYFLIENKTKREIRGDSMKKFWIGSRHPVSVSSESLVRVSRCDLSETSSLFSSYSLACSVPIESLGDLPGDTYEITLTLPEKTDIRRIDASFKTTVAGSTLRARISKLKDRVLSRYLPTQSP